MRKFQLCISRDADACYGGTKPSPKPSPVTMTTIILENIYSKAAVPHLSSVCSVEQDSHKLVFHIAAISGENNGFGI